MKFIELFKNSSIQIFDDRKYWTDEQKETEISEQKLTMQEFLGNMANYKTMNDLGAGVFFQPNAGGRRKEEVTSIEWAYMEMDDGTKEEQMKKIETSPIAPCMIIESMKSFHCYWWLEAMTEDQFNDLVNGLVIYFGADPANTQVNRVFRLQGYKHMKYFNKPFDVKRIKFEPVRMKYADMIQAYPKPMDKWKKEYSFGNDDLYILKDIPIKEVLDKFGVKYNRKNEILEKGEVTSAVINTKLNYINRFSGKPPSGTGIDVTMFFLGTDVAGAIKWLRDEFYPNRKVEQPTRKVESQLKIKDSDDRYTWGTHKLNHSMPLLERGRFSLIYGEAKRGKTTFVFDMAQKNAIEKKHKILYLSLEMSKDDLVHELANKYAGITVGEAYDKAIPESKLLAREAKIKELQGIDNLIFEGMRWQNDRSWEACMAKILSHTDLDLVIVDNLNSLSRDQKENEYDFQARVAQEIGAFCSQYNLPVILIHHTRKKSTAGTSQGSDDMAGSKKLQQIVDYLIRIQRVHDPKNEDQDEDKFYETKVIVEQTRYWDSISKSIFFHKGSFYDYHDYKALRYKDKEKQIALRRAPDGFLKD